MRRHVSAEVLARYQEGDLSTRKTASIAAHLSSCERCARTRSDLTAVSSLLAAIEQPVMPPALADRLQLAIARESAARAAGGVSDARLAEDKAAGSAAHGSVAGAGHPGGCGEEAAPGAHIPGRPDLPERRAGRRISWPRLHWPGLSSPVLLRGTAAIAVVIVLAGAGFLFARGVSGPESSARSGSGGSGSVPGNASGPAHRPESRQLPAGLTGAARLHYRLHGKIITATAVVSHLDFTRNGLAGQVQRAIGSHVTFGPGAVTSPSPTNGGAGHPMLGGIKIGKLNGCLDRVSGGRRVVLAEIARYLGRPATIVVLKSLTANVFDVAIVGVACSASAADYIVQTTVPAG